MNCVDLIKKIENCIVPVIFSYIDPIEKIRKFNRGAGTIIDKNGNIITVAHNISDLIECINDKEKYDFVIEIFIRSIGLIEYEILYYPGNIILPDLKNKEHILDMVILQPKIKLHLNNYMSLNFNRLETGEETLIAGYPIDIEYEHLSLMNYLPYEKNTRNTEIFQKFSEYARPITYKKCIVSSQESICLGNIINGQIYYLDVIVNKGMSGGPIINESGELSGVIVQTTKCEISTIPENSSNLLKFYIPSGSCIGKSISSFPPFHGVPLAEIFKSY